MDDLFRTYAVTIIQAAQVAKGLSDADLANRLRFLGADVSGWTLQRRIAADLSAGLFLRCLTALEIEQLETASLVRFIEALSCPSCAPFRQLPRLPHVDHDDTPIPF